MTGKRTSDSLDDRVSRYLAGELSAREQRELAQSALDDPALFETLTSAALLKDAARRADPPAPAPAAGPRQRRRTPLIVILGVSMAAAAVIGIIMVRRPPPDLNQARPSQTADARTPSSVDSPAASTPPVFLTARVDPPVGRPGEFRSGEAGSRLPKREAAVASVDGDDVAVDLGSLDGVVKGSTLRVFRPDAREPVATLVATTVFRERMRGRVTPGSAPQPGDRVEVSRSDHVSALLQRAGANAAAGDLTLARQAADLAVTQAQPADAPPDVRRRALFAMGTIEHRAGALEEAAGHLRLAVDALDTAPVASRVERADALGELGDVLIERGEYAEAERILGAVQPLAAGRGAVRIANNLAALAALRGDRAAAASRYQSAIDMAGASPELEADRRVIRNNLERLQAPR